jgi:hypothetical protein
MMRQGAVTGLDSLNGSLSAPGLLLEGRAAVVFGGLDLRLEMVLLALNEDGEMGIDFEYSIFNILRKMAL